MGQLEESPCFPALSVATERSGTGTDLTGPAEQEQRIDSTVPSGSFLTRSYGGVLQIGKSFLIKGLTKLYKLRTGSKEKTLHF